MALIVVNGDATFTSTRRMSGTGVLVVLGDLTVSASSYSSYNGLVYTTGDYTQNAPSQVSGAVISRGTVNINGTSDFSEVVYDSGVLAQIQRHMGQYRFNRNQRFSAR
jgi:formylmethanofuran dehydrogenase subunit C